MKWWTEEDRKVKYNFISHLNFTPTRVNDVIYRKIP